MESDSYLLKVGLEGFALVDELFKPGKPPTQSYDHHHYNNEIDWPKKPARFPAQPQPFDHRHHYNNSEYGYGRFQRGYMYRGPQVIKVRQPVIDCNQAAERYGGVVFVDHRIGSTIRKNN